MEPHRLALPAGYRIENYEIQGVLGKGGFGITYVAYDWTLGRHMAIKELLPDSIATRIEGSTVVAMGPAHEESWQWARERFVEEARILAGFRHPNIIAVHRLIEANGTVYLVMDHLEGESYETRLRRIGREPGQESLMRVIAPLLDGLQEVHAAGLLHRDIKPENILFDKRGNPILIDFGAARATVGATMTMTSIVTHGYSPIEQYQTKGRMGPWTDIYAVASVMCRAITGEKPPVASDRIMDDDFIWLSNRGLAGFDGQFLTAVDWALRLRPEARPQKIADWEPYLLPSSHSTPPVSEVAAGPIARPPKPQEKAAIKEAEAWENAAKETPFENSLGMKFVPVTGTEVLFSIWDTRVKDFREYAESSGYRQQGGICVWNGAKWKLDATASWERPGFQQTAYHPVVGVSWEEAQAFCKWLTEKERSEGKISKDKAYRLPTDAEWSTAVGATKFPWGREWPPPKDAGNYDPSLGVDSYDNTSPVGSFPANRFGLYDMGGNVWQWCEDWYRADMNETALLEKYGFLKDDGGGRKYRVVRGASWYNYAPEYLSSSARSNDLPDIRDSINGFRCVLGSSR